MAMRTINAPLAAAAVFITACALRTDRLPVLVERVLSERRICAASELTQSGLAGLLLEPIWFLVRL